MLIYGAGIWGFADLKKIESVQMQFFCPILGANNFSTSELLYQFVLLHQISFIWKYGWQLSTVAISNWYIEKDPHAASDCEANL